jgi:hypothetical protein
MPIPPIVIQHNFLPDAFMWLWAKYVVGFNERYHCTNCLRGRYSRRFSKARNPHLATDREIFFDERSDHRAIYICGVARQGYSGKKNYPHNVHLAIRPAPGVESDFGFEQWRVAIKNGSILVIPGPDSLPANLRSLPARFTTCRIFRWGAANARSLFDSAPIRDS